MNQELSINIKDTILFGHLLKNEDDNYKFTNNIIEVYKIVKPILDNQIPKTFQTYTLHDVAHSIRIMQHMALLIEDINKLSCLEIAVLIYSALLHDIGMAVSEEDKHLIQSNQYSLTDESYDSYLKKHNNNESEAMQDYVRKIHGRRSAVYIREQLIDGKNTIEDYLFIPGYPNTSFSNEVSLICESHSEDYNWLLNKLRYQPKPRLPKYETVKGSYIINPMFCAILLRFGDILDFDNQRVPPSLYELIKPKEKSNEEWKKQFSIENFNKIREDIKTGSKVIHFDGNCSEPRIHRGILTYFKGINREILDAREFTTDMKHHYKFNLIHPVENNIIPDGYTISDLALTLEYESITQLLMGKNLYSEPKIGLRELVQNAIDACMTRKEIEDKIQCTGKKSYKSEIKIILDKPTDRVIIKDNGTGMSLYILKKYFLNAGVSYYISDDFRLKGYNYRPIGKYGIGFLSCFMLSDTVLVKTQYYDEDIIFQVSMTRNNQFVVINEESASKFEGTEIILEYSKFSNVFASSKDIINFLNKYFLTEAVQINVLNTEEGKLELVDNPLTFIKDDKSDKNHVIDLSKYLVDINGYISLVVQKPFAHRHINELVDRNRKLVYFDGDNLKLIDDNFDQSLLLNNKQLKYWNIPLIEDEAYQHAASLLDDNEEEIIDFLKDKVTNLSIFIKEGLDIEINDHECLQIGDEITDNLLFDDLIKFGLEMNWPTKIYSAQQNVFFDNGELFFTLINDIIAYSSSKIKTRLYIRNVLIDQYSFYLWGPPIISSLKLSSIDINSFNENISPNISRDKLDHDSDTALSYAITKAIHFWALESLSLTKAEKSLLKEFINANMNRESILLKSDYNKQI